MPDMAQENRRIRADQSGLVVPFPGSRGDDSRRTNLPAAVSSFVGRERELTEIGDLLGDNRLLTLTGPGGVGKTRLALAAAGALVEVMDDGVWMVEFAPLSDTSLVAQAVASVLRVREQPGRPLLEVLSDHLVGKRLLLVFDNCEHMIDACAELAATLLSACPELRMLCTSREALGISGEIVWSVPLLTVPEPGQTVGLAELSGYEAVRLLVDRTTAVDRLFVLNDDNAARGGTALPPPSGDPARPGAGGSAGQGLVDRERLRRSGQEPRSPGIGWQGQCSASPHAAGDHRLES